MKKIFTAILIAASASLASADGLKSLENFMKGTQTLAGRGCHGLRADQPSRAGTSTSRWPLAVRALTKPAFSMSSSRRAERL